MKLWKKSGTLFIATGIIHNTFGFIFGWGTLKAIAQDGFLNSINMEMSRNAIFWFLFSGFMIIILGNIMQKFINENQKPVPSYIGYYLLALAIIGCIMMPASGFWLVLPQALIIILANKNATVRATT